MLLAESLSARYHVTHQTHRTHNISTPCAMALLWKSSELEAGTGQMDAAATCHRAVPNHGNTKESYTWQASLYSYRFKLPQAAPTQTCCG